jgi:DNA polymerase I-like protein with 3'-5' exonuclease and polymerase domains
LDRVLVMEAAVRIQARTGLRLAHQVHNCVQALDRVLVMEAAVRIQARTGLRLAHQVHDELVYVVPKEQVPEFRAVIKAEMERRPAWGLDLPLAAETGAGPNFGQVSE